MGAEVFSYKTGFVDFNRFSRETTIPTAQDEVRRIIDINMSMFCEPTLAPLHVNNRFDGPEDLRLYINEHDVTAQLLDAFKDQIRLLPAPIVRASYLRGVEQYLGYVQSFPAPPPVSGDLAFAQSYSAMADWGDAFLRLGDRGVGWSGNLHIINYLYRFIPILPISLTIVWQKYRDAVDPSLPETLNGFDKLVIILSQGPSPSVSTASPSQTMGGRLTYQLRYVYPNPLDTRLRVIATELRNLSRTVFDLQTNYLDELAAGLQTVEANFVAHTNATVTALDELKDTVDHIAGP